MKRLIAFVLALLCAMSLLGCNKQASEQNKAIEGNLKTYYELSDGSWECDGHTYKYKLEITGRMHNAVKNTTYVYLSNIKNISFQEAMLAGGLSSNTEDYFNIEEAVLVEMK